MIDLLVNIAMHPYGIAVILLSLFSAYGGVIFLWGWSGYILAHGDKEHQAHARSQMVSGFFALLVALSVWEAVRSIAAVASGSNSIPTFSGYIILVWFAVWLWLFLKKSFKKKSAH
jgi:hypothetical protein